MDVMPKSFLGRIGLLILAVLLVVEPLLHGGPYFGYAAVLGFNIWYGLAICFVIVLAARVAHGFLRRPERYYEED